MGDRAAQGRTYGNLGNTFYLLGDFEKAVSAHEKRLLIAKEFGDKSAERRGHCNLGNAHIFLGQFDVAAGHYKRTLQLARLLKDRAVEAQACYSLGNTYTLLQDYERAIDYHLKHLIIAQDLEDRVGEGRACWSLGNAHTALGNHEQAMHFAEKHLEIAKETGDKSGEMTARMNLSDLRLVVGLKSSANLHPNSYCSSNSSALASSYQGYYTLLGVKAQSPSQNNTESLQLPGPNEKQSGHSEQELDEEKSSKNNTIKASNKLFLFQRIKSKMHKNSQSPPKGLKESSSESLVFESEGTPFDQPGSQDSLGEDGFFDLLSRFQGSRMDDQRCTLLEGQSSVPVSTSPMSTPPVAERKCVLSGEAPPQDPGHLQELLACSQDRRLDDQRVSKSHLPGLRLGNTSPPPALSTSQPQPAHPQALGSSSCPPPPASPCRETSAETSAETPQGDDFFDMLVKCQGSRLDDQRCAAPPPAARGPTVPDEDFLSLILRSQANRMEEQRVAPPSGCSQPKPD